MRDFEDLFSAFTIGRILPLSAIKVSIQNPLTISRCKATYDVMNLQSWRPRQADPAATPEIVRGRRANLRAPVSSTRGVHGLRRHGLIPLLVPLALLAPLMTGCGLIKEKPKDQPDLDSVATRKLSPEETKGLLKDVGNNWLYGEGLGSTAITVGTVVVFPPYALFLLGNAALSLSGYQPVDLTDALPDAPRHAINSAYDGVASAPGHVAAAIAGEEFRTKEVASDTLKKYINGAPKAGASEGPPPGRALSFTPR